MMQRSAPLAFRRGKAAGRFRLTTVGATAARSMASSPTWPGVCHDGSTQTGPGMKPP